MQTPRRAKRETDFDPNTLNVGYILCHGNVTNFDTIERHFTTSVKSILIFTDKMVNFRIVSDSVSDIREMIERNIPEQYWSRFDIRGDETQKEMDSLKESLKFKGCGHLKMTFHHTFGEIDSLLLLDADTLLLNPIEGNSISKSTFHIELIFQSFLPKWTTFHLIKFWPWQLSIRGMITGTILTDLMLTIQLV